MDLINDVFKPVAMLLGLSYFISLIIFDACVAVVGKSARIWNPGKSLLISALTIQILSYLKVKIIKSSEDFDRKDILQNTFVGESGRVVTCVLIGYLLPGMARAGSATDWRTLVALVLSLFTSEFYSLVTLFYKEPPDESDSCYRSEGCVRVRYTYDIVAGMVIVLSIILVVLFSISAILVGRTLRGMLAQKISVIEWNKKKVDEKDSWEKFEDEMVESWFLARVCDPQYVIARSVLISAVGVVVTVCILFLGYRHFCVYVHGLHLLYYRSGALFMAWVLEWGFILIGGTVILCRWVTAAIYYPRFFGKKKKLIRPFVEDYWTRSILELIQMYNLQKRRLGALSRDGIQSGLVVCVATTMKLHYLLYLLWPLQISVVFFSKCCFFVSELLFSFKFLRVCFLGRVEVASQSHKESHKYNEILKKVCMPGENPTSLWLANVKLLSRVKKKHLEENKKKGRDCNDLIALIKPHFHPESDDYEKFVNQLEKLPFVTELYPTLDVNCMRMTALLLLNVIINLSPSQNDGKRLKEAIEAYRQAFDFMSFVDDSDPPFPTSIDVLKVIDIDADRVSVAVCNEFSRLLKLQEEKLNSLKKAPKQDPETPPERALKIINDLLDEAEKELNVQKLANTSGGDKQNVEEEEQNDSRDWSAVAVSYNKYRVCKLILSRSYVNDKELMDYLYRLLADAIGCCLLRSPFALVKKCREWAVQFEEDKIWDAMIIAGKVVGVVQKYIQVEGNFPEPALPTYKDNPTQAV